MTTQSSPLNFALTRTEHRAQLAQAIQAASVALMGEDSPIGYLAAMERFDRAQKALQSFEQACELEDLALARLGPKQPA